MKNSSINSKVMTLANKLRWEKGMSQSEAARKAWKVVKLKEAMKAGAVEFTYTKTDGTERKATGTTSNEFFTYTRKTERAPAPIDLITYYDLDKSAFRRFKAENIKVA